MSEYVSNADDLDNRATTIVLCKNIGDTLERHYPGWLWAIQPDETGGILAIRALRLSGEWGYVFRLADLQGDSKVVAADVMRAGGEILERFGVPRGTYRYEDWARTTKDIAGLAMPDLSDKHAKVRRHQRDAALTNALQFGTAKLVIRETTDRDGTVRRDYALKREDAP